MSNDRDDFGESVPDLVDRFVEDFEPFVTSKSSRATPLGQVWCRCEDSAHAAHLPRKCDWDVFNDGYCRECFIFLTGSTSAGG